MARLSGETSLGCIASENKARDEPGSRNTLGMALEDWAKGRL